MIVRDLDGRIFLSASDLMRFMGCPHATILDLVYMRGTGPKPGEDTEDAALLQKQGGAHEAAHLARLKEAGRTVMEIERGKLGENAEATRAALAAGPDVVFHGAFLSGNWGGWSDFLERVETPSALGPFSYEVADTKLKRRPHPKHVLQLVLYSDLLTEIQEVVPEFAHVELGDGTRATLRLADYSAYARMARQRLEAFVADPQPTRPMPCADCGLCSWADHCKSVWQTEDSLFNVANISRGQYAPYEITAIKRLITKSGIGEAFLDRLLRERRFVDLFAVVRGGLIGSEPNYSIKSMESFYDRKRDGEVKTAGAQVFALPIVQFLEQFTDGLAGLGQGEEAAVAQAGQDAALDHLGRQPPPWPCRGACVAVPARLPCRNGPPSRHRFD